MFLRYNMIGHDVCPILPGLFLFKIEQAGCDQVAARILSGVMQREMTTPQGSVKLPYL